MAECLDEGAEMLARYLEGENRAFEEIVGRFGESVYGYLRRAGVQAEAADDLFQEVFLRVHLAARRYRPDFPFRVWLFSITQNLMRSHFRRQRVRRILTGWWRRPRVNDPHGDPEPFDPPDDTPGVEREIEAREQLQRLEKALSGLPEGPRRAVLLTQLEGLSLEEAARILGVGLPTVKTWIRRCRLALADALLRDAGGGMP